MVLKKKKSFTDELAQKNKANISNIRSNSANNTIQITQLLQIFLRELILTEKVYRPFWNRRCADISKNLWLPTKIHCVDSVTNLSNGSLEDTVDESSFWMKRRSNPKKPNSQTIYYPLSMSSVVNNWEKDVIKNLKVRIYPTPAQRKIFKEWFGTTRYVYN
ncbi:hypothetical protein [Heterosigma akashiwo virus 01]|jgi:hypothetical protein|uniref:Transposase putative helix-turn-helix domain-containing protein n=1 Tax=Heterosigma akashiwo virus 01 TaxID=97195 RepID=A0A1C9C4X0_HAV01|nr:hypothetical protein D1R72_gp003 [Heterosigma akashiwo virus 01]AOM63334.1 hypothetical protein [Heterosigma akashiwo virus 01]